MPASDGLDDEAGAGAGAGADGEPEPKRSKPSTDREALAAY